MLSFFKNKSENSSNPLINRYKNLRKVGIHLHRVMMNNSKIDFEPFLLGSAHFWGMLEKINGQNALIMEDPIDMDVLNDFAFFDYFQDDKNFTELYYELNQSKLKPLEKETLDAKLNYFISLFEVIDRNKERCEITLRDILYPEEEDIVIIDLNYSQSVIVGSLMFTRIIPFEDLNMTSGMPFPFYEENKDKIIKKHNTNMKKPSGYSESARMFKSFFQLHKKYGISVNYKELE